MAKVNTMNRHTIKIDELELIIRHPLAASVGKNEHKTLVLEYDLLQNVATYLVKSQGQAVYDGYSLDEAVQAYNEA